MDGTYVVRQIKHAGGQRSWWIVSPEGGIHTESVRFLTQYVSSTQQTYAYSLVDHLNWLRANHKNIGEVTFDDLSRYMRGISGNDGVHGAAYWRPDHNPLGASAARNVATVVRALYLSVAYTGGSVRPELIKALNNDGFRSRDRGKRSYTSNPLAPRKINRIPRALSDETVGELFKPGVLRSARDVMIVTWLHDTGIRVGGLCGLRFSDLHLTKHHPCGQREQPHIHIVGRDDNPNNARAKSYTNFSVSKEGYVLDGVIRSVSPDMLSTYYAYLLDEYQTAQIFADHHQVLVHLSGTSRGQALTTSGVRKLLRRACSRAGLNERITPHAFRHKAAAALYEASGFNAELVAQEFGWSDPALVTALYGRAANRAAISYLRKAWETTSRPDTESFEDYLDES